MVLPVDSTSVHGLSVWLISGVVYRVEDAAADIVDGPLASGGHRDVGQDRNEKRDGDLFMPMPVRCHRTRGFPRGAHRRLIAMHYPELGGFERPVMVVLGPPVIDQHVPGGVHGFQREIALAIGPGR